MLNLRSSNDENSGVKRRPKSVRSLSGQLLFAELDSNTLTVDCVLDHTTPGTGGPISITAHFPHALTSPVTAVTLLQRWAEEAAPIEITISHERSGAHVQIAAPSGRVVLEPARAAAG